MQSKRCDDLLKLGANSVDALRGIDDREAVRRLFRAAQVLGARAREERIGLAFEAVRLARRAAPLAGGVGRDVEQDGQIGLKTALHPAFKRFQLVARQAAAAALIGKGRVGKAVRQHPVAACERRLDHAREMLATRREHQQRLGFEVHLLVQQEIAQRFAERRAARFARHDHRAAAGSELVLELLAEPGQMRGLARAVDALERDESATRHLVTPDVFVDGLVVVDEIVGKHAAAVAARHEIQRAGRRRIERCLQCRGAGQRDWRWRQPWAQVRIVKSVGLQIALVQTPQIARAHPVDHRRIGLQRHAHLETVREYGGHQRTVAGLAGFLFDQRSERQRLVRRLQRQTRRARDPCLVQMRLHQLVGAAEDVQIARTLVEQIGVGEEQALAAALGRSGRADRRQKLGVVHARRVVAQRRIRVELVAHALEGPAFDNGRDVFVDVAERHLLQHFVGRDARLEFVIARFEMALQAERAGHQHEQLGLDRHAAAVQLGGNAAHGAVRLDGDVELLDRECNGRGGPVPDTACGGCAQHGARNAGGKAFLQEGHGNMTQGDLI
ncbi:hypothetical protein PT2222_310028 [Paraburkholderia tropica]